MKSYAGIGSRETPVKILALMQDVAAHLAGKGYVLRSGAAAGADSAFETGCDRVGGAKEIYLPWKGFNGHVSTLFSITPEALNLAERHHPAWERLSDNGKLLIARDGYQVLGSKLDDPARFVVCWTKGARVVGGTGQALRLALSKGVPVLNLADLGQHTKVLQWLTLNLDFLEPTMYDLFVSPA